MRFQRSHPTAKAASTIIAALLFSAITLSQPAQAKTKFKGLHTFHGPNGAFPTTQLTRDASGNLYGTTSEGGSGVCTFGNSKVSCGTAFKLDKTGKQVWLHSFHYSGGESPMAGLLRDAAGNLYGTTVYGGTNGSSCGSPKIGCGVVFKLDKTGKETVLHRFKGGASDGDEPEALMMQDSAGNLYGSTIQGGQYGYGTVFELDTSGAETILHDFCGGDGAYPMSVLIWDSAGNLYGTTQAGGSSSVCEGGCGTVFELSPGSGGWTEKVLYSFCSVSGCADGWEPLSGPLVRDTAGNLYGTTYFGGSYRNCNGELCGVVFKLDSSGNETVLHSLTGGADGALPWGGLVMAKSGELYGTARYGGDAKCYKYGCGTVFKITP